MVWWLKIPERSKNPTARVLLAARRLLEVSSDTIQDVLRIPIQPQKWLHLTQPELMQVVYLVRTMAMAVSTSAMHQAQFIPMPKISHPDSPLLVKRMPLDCFTKTTVSLYRIVSMVVPRFMPGVQEKEQPVQ